MFYTFHFLHCNTGIAVYAIVMCLCVCVFLSLVRYCVKTAEPVITQTMPHYSLGLKVFVAKHLCEIQTGSY